MHQNLFSARKSEILCTKIFFLHENPRFCALKSFLCTKIRDSVHQNLFSARKSEILCTKIFSLHENLRFCISKSFCVPHGSIERGTKKRMYHKKMLIHPLIEAKTRGARNEIGLFLDDACLSPLLYKSLDIGQSHCSLYIVVRREQVG